MFNAKYFDFNVNIGADLGDSTGLSSGIDAHCGSKLRLILIMHQPHLRNPPQVISGVHLEKEKGRAIFAHLYEQKIAKLFHYQRKT